MFMVFTYIEDEKAANTSKFGQESSVVVAKVDIQELELIDNSKVMVKSFPQRFLSPGHFKTIKEVENTVATVPILKGEQVTKPRVTYPGVKTGLSRQIAVGKRAIAVNIGVDSGVAKLLRPGDRVDILVFLDIASGDKSKQKVKTLLQDVLVLSTGRNITNSIPLIGVETPQVIEKMNLSTYTNYQTVVLELGPYETQKMLFSVKGDLRPYLVLRNNNDRKRGPIESTDIFDVLGEGKDALEAKSFFNSRQQRGG